MPPVMLPWGAWHKATASAMNGNCVEVAHMPGRRVGVRDSKNTAGPVLLFTGPAWQAFLAAAKKGNHDLS